MSAPAATSSPHPLLGRLVASRTLATAAEKGVKDYDDLELVRANLNGIASG